MLTITDTTLCAVDCKKVDIRQVRAFYLELLGMGVTYVQIPVQAWEPLKGVLDARRTVSVCPDLPGRTVRETRMGKRVPQGADEIRWTADGDLFMQDYPRIFEELAAEPQASFCTKGAGNLGTALTVEWVAAGGENVAASVMGVGGYAPLEEVLAALHTAGYPLPPIRLDRLRRLSERFQSVTGRRVPLYQPVIGAGIYDVESGVHVDGIAKNRACYEPFAPETVGARRRIRIGKHSGKGAVAFKLKELGMEGGYDLERLLSLARMESIKTGRALEDTAFAALAECARETISA